MSHLSKVASSLSASAHFTKSQRLLHNFAANPNEMMALCALLAHKNNLEQVDVSHACEPFADKLVHRYFGSASNASSMEPAALASLRGTFGKSCLPNLATACLSPKDPNNVLVRSLEYSSGTVCSHLLASKLLQKETPYYICMHMPDSHMNLPI